METNSKIPFTDVTCITKDMLEFITNVEHKIVYTPVKLIKNGVLKDYTSVIVCKKDDEAFLKYEISKFNGLNKDEFIIPNKFCHVTTYEGDKKNDFISFDKNDNYHIHADFNDDNSFIENFFKSFISFRNNLIEKRQVVKRDDIYQYLSSIIGFTEKERVKRREKFNKIRNK